MSSANLAEIERLESFRGERCHTGQWPHEPVDFSGHSVAVIGTGSSAIQSILLIAEQAKQLTVFQRSPNYAVPAHTRPLDPSQVAQVKANYAGFREAMSQTAFHGGVCRFVG